MKEKLKQLFERREYFNHYLPKLEGSDRRNDIKNIGNTCPSCGFPTLNERCNWEICSICFWEDDGQDDMDADEVFGGPNGDFSLTQHRIKWEENLSEIKKDTSEIGENLRRVDELIFKGHKSGIQEIIELTKAISNWFDSKRGLKR